MEISKKTLIIILLIGMCLGIILTIQTVTKEAQSIARECNIELNKSIELIRNNEHYYSYKYNSTGRNETTLMEWCNNTIFYVYHHDEIVSLKYVDGDKIQGSYAFTYRPQTNSVDVRIVDFDSDSVEEIKCVCGDK